MNRGDGCLWKQVISVHLKLRLYRYRNSDIYRTFIANVCGCFLIGIFYGWVAKRDFMTKTLNLLLITGLCGGFTTFSSFSDDMISLLEKGDVSTFWLYMGASLIAGVVMVALGIACVSSKKDQNSVVKS